MNQGKFEGNSKLELKRDEASLIKLPSPFPLKERGTEGVR
jgi:hypothetical protein